MGNRGFTWGLLLSSLTVALAQTSINTLVNSGSSVPVVNGGSSGVSTPGLITGKPNTEERNANKLLEYCRAA